MISSLIDHLTTVCRALYADVVGRYRELRRPYAPGDPAYTQDIALEPTASVHDGHESHVVLVRWLACSDEYARRIAELYDAHTSGVFSSALIDYWADRYTAERIARHGYSFEAYLEHPDLIEQMIEVRTRRRELQHAA